MKMNQDEIFSVRDGGWQHVAAKYARCGRADATIIPYLLADTAVSAGMLVLDVACGPGYVSAAAETTRRVFPQESIFSEKMVATGEANVSRDQFTQVTHRTCHFMMAVSIVCL